jgi:lipoyl(octanoyl) transferase
VAISDVLAYLRTMEAAIIASLATAGVPAGVREGLTGVWAGERKIASIGVHVSRGVTTHGFAINVENDLQPFSWVVPCGLEGVNMTSVSRELGRGLKPAHPMACFRRQAAHGFCEAFGRRQRLVSPVRLGLTDAPLAPARAPDREPAPA